MGGTGGDGDGTRATLNDGARSARQPGAFARHRSPALELFILGELMDGPHHGYLLRDILTRMLGPYYQVSWAAIYPLIHQMQQQGLIAEVGQVPKAAGAGDGTRNRRPRRSWSITEAGRQRFVALMSADEPYSGDFPESFAIKLMYLRHCAPQRRQAILAHARTYFERQREHLRHVFTAQSTTSHLPTEQRDEIFRMMRFRLAGAEAQLRWIESEQET